MATAGGNYTRWVADNPQTATDAETAVKIGSFVVGGYFRDSPHFLVISELLQKAVGLLAFVNDRILDNAYSKAALSDFDKRVEVALGVVETFEVVFEISAGLTAGETAKWAVVVVVQIVKAVLRLALLWRRRKLLKQPTLAAVDRDGVARRLRSGEEEAERLLRTGRSVRTLASAPTSLSGRRWIPPNPNESFPLANDALPALDRAGVAAEVIYACRPLAHLTMLGACGTASWIPFGVSVACDLGSLLLHSRGEKPPDANQGLTARKELWRRRLSLLTYLLRSPLYDSLTRRYMLALMVMTKKKIPFGKSVVKFLVPYLAHYRAFYAHLWAN